MDIVSSPFGVQFPRWCRQELQQFHLVEFQQFGGWNLWRNFQGLGGDTMEVGW